jgi:hypothetical protein
LAHGFDVVIPLTTHRRLVWLSAIVVAVALAVALVFGVLTTLEAEGIPASAHRQPDPSDPASNSSGVPAVVTHRHASAVSPSIATHSSLIRPGCDAHSVVTARSICAQRCSSSMRARPELPVVDRPIWKHPGLRACHGPWKPAQDLINFTPRGVIPHTGSGCTPRRPTQERGVALKRFREP